MKPKPTPFARSFDMNQLRRQHVADQCVCCGSLNLTSTPAILMPFVAHRTFGWAPVMIDESWGLKTVQKGMAYTVCRSLMCSDCGLLFSDIRFSDDELTRLYQDYRGLAYTDLREHYEPSYTLRNNALMQQLNYDGMVERFLKPLLHMPPKILDWGGDTGKNTPFRDQCKKLDIYDISKAPVIDGANAVSREQAKGNQYDLFVCSNVLEHVPYPSDTLLDITQIMQKESIIYVEVPLEDIIIEHGSNALQYKKHWHEHVNFFNPIALQSLLKNCGLITIAQNNYTQITAGLKTSYLMQVACRLT